MSSFTYFHPLNSKPCTIIDVLKKHKFSLSLRRKLKQENIITINGSPTHINSLLHPGDKLNLFFTDHVTITPSNLPLDICYEDEHLLIVNKPAGQLVHPTVKESSNTLANAIIQYYENNHLSCNYHPVNRLDRNTSGLVIIAKNPYIHSLLSDTFIKKHYLAVVSGTLNRHTQTICAPIGRKDGSIIEREVRSDGQHAVTHLKLLYTANNLSLLRIIIDTGRTHQIRVHLSHIGHPILGDDLYGGKKDHIARQALHAYKLIFIHPFTNKKMCIVKSLPNDIRFLLRLMHD